MSYLQRQDMRLLQKFALTTQMRHSIQILGMSVSDLNGYIDAILSSNPFLEKKAEEKPLYMGLPSQKKHLSALELNETTDIEQKVNPKQDLLFQIRALGLTEQELEIAVYLVSEINQDGYIRVGSEEVAEDLLVDAEDVERIVALIQKLDPPGIGARNVRECLLLQIERRGKKDSLEYRIINEHLSDLAVNDTLGISRALGIDREQVTKAVLSIKKLNPRPASSLLSEAPAPVIPDLVATVKDGKIRLEINRGYIPTLRLYNPYANELDIVKDPEAKKFLRKNTRAANQLLDNIKRREDTLCRVAYHMLKFHQDCIESGNPYKKILTRHDLAGTLGLHHSTISRTVSNKFLELNRKVIPLTNLITEGVPADNGEHTSKTHVKDIIRTLIKNEDKKRPLTDLRIMKELNTQGISIQRRTVAKYRESLRILPTHLRKNSCEGEQKRK